MTSLPHGLHGAHLRSDLAALVGRSTLRAALREGRLTSFSRTVVVDPHRVGEFHTRAAAALLTLGDTAVLSGQSALAVHGCAAAETAPVHLLVPYTRRTYRRTGLVTHQGTVDGADIDAVAGLRAHVPQAALAEVLCRGSRRTALACADAMLRLLAGHEREAFRTRVAGRVDRRPDTRGCRQAHELLTLASGLAESPAESGVLLTLVDGGLPVPEQQVPILDHRGVVLYRLDFAWREARVAVEYDGYRWHEGRRDSDAARDEDLRRRGWTVVHADARDLVEPARLRSEVRELLRRRGLPLWDGSGDSRV